MLKSIYLFADLPKKYYRLDTIRLVKQLYTG